MAQDALLPGLPVGTLGTEWQGRIQRRDGAQVVAGQPVDVVLSRPRVFYTGRGDFRTAELHATAKRLALAPRRKAPPSSATPAATPSAPLYQPPAALIAA